MKRSWVIRNPAIAANCVEAIDTALEAGQLVRVTIEPYRKKRTGPQNNTLHMWFGEIAEATGESRDRVKVVLKQKFYPHHDVLVLGELVHLPKSTADLDIAEMADVMEQVQSWAAEWNFPLTQPEARMHTT